MKRITGRTERGRNGNALIETVLVLSLVLLPLTFWTIDFTYYFFVRSNVEAAAREGARAAIVDGATVANIDAAITQAMNAAGLSQAKSHWTRTLKNATTGTTISSLSSVASGQLVEVQVNCTWGNVQLTPTYLNLIGGNSLVSGQTVMRKE